MLKKISILVCISLFSQLVVAAPSDSSTEKLINTFTQCDSQFFYQLNKNRAQLSDIVDVINEKDLAYIPVADMENAQGYTTYFKQPIMYKGLKFTGYQDIYIETPWLGTYYYWGLVVDNQQEEVVKTLSEINWRPFSPTSYIANAKLYENAENKRIWEDNPYAIDGLIPRNFTVEKSLSLEKLPDGTVHLLCSIQGDINNELLNEIRPDLKLHPKTELKPAPEKSLDNPSAENSDLNESI